MDKYKRVVGNKQWDVLMIKRNFVFTVSLVAMFAVSSAWADAATGNAVGTAHTVYDNSGLNMAESGIAGVTYVNRMVNAAGNSAQRAEAHAASAGASALSAAADAKEAADAADVAAQAAQTANNTLANKQDKLVAGSNITIAADGKTISATDMRYTLPTASSDTKGGVKIGSGVNVATDGTISVAAPGNATLKIQRNGVDVDTFTANASTDKTINITVPTGALADKSTITSGDITDYAIGAIDLGTDSVETAKIKDAAVTKAKLSTDVQASLNLADSAVQPAAISDMQVKSLMVKNTSEYNNAADKSAVYPSASYMITAIEGAQSDLTADIEKAQETADAAVVKAQGAGAANKAVITDASGNITTGTIATGMIATGAVTAAKTSGVIGFIPSGSAAATTYAQIWVE